MFAIKTINYWYHKQRQLPGNHASRTFEFDTKMNIKIIRITETTGSYGDSGSVPNSLLKG